MRTHGDVRDCMTEALGIVPPEVADSCSGKLTAWACCQWLALELMASSRTTIYCKPPTLVTLTLHT